MTKPIALSVQPASIPAELKAINRWIVWRYVEPSKEGSKWRKVPHGSRGQQINHLSPSAWRPFNSALDDYLLGNFDGIGFVFDGSDGLSGFDIDNCIDPLSGEWSGDALAISKRLQGYAEVSPSGTGIKIIAKTNLKAGRAVKGFEAYSSGRFFTVTGHVIYGHNEIAAGVQDVDWFVETYLGGTNRSAGSSDALAMYKPPLEGWDIERVRAELVEHIGDIESYNAWNELGMMLHHQGQGGDEWRELWRELSQNTSTYDPNEIELKWDSFSLARATGTGVITIASLIKKAQDARAEERKRIFDEWKLKIDAIADGEAGLVLCRNVSKDSDLDRIDRDVLAQLLKIKFKQVGYPVSLPDIKKLLRPRVDDSMPEWLQDWVYITHEDKFFNLTSKRKVTANGFNAMFNRELGAAGAGDVKANALALDVFKIRTPHKIIYLPHAPELFEMDGEECANAYDPNSPPDIPSHFTSSDLVAINTVKDHVSMLMKGEQEAVDLMFSWMAYNVQNPGRKVNWVPLIKGIEGDGKSVLGKLMAAVMGNVNVGLVDPAAIGSGFTAWAGGRCVNVLEEIRLVGHSRHDILNALKPFITNEKISIHPKGINPYDAPNVTNYMAFTNHVDALPLEDVDRRWWIRFTPFNTKADLASMADGHYFDRLHGAIQNHPGALRRWLLEYQINDSFQPMGHAPASTDKLVMISLNASDELESMKEVLETGAPGVSKELFSSSHLTTATSMSEEGVAMRTSALSKALAKLGYTRWPKKVKWQGNAVKVWSDGTMTARLTRMKEEDAHDAIRQALDRTLGSSILD